MKRVSVYSLVAWALVLAWVGFSGPSALAAPLDTAELGAGIETGQQIKEVQEAVTRFQNGDINGARALLAAAVKKHADLPPPDVIMAQLYAAANQLDRAVLSLEAANKESPTDPEASVILGDLAFRGGRVSEARLMYAEAYRLLAEFKGSAKRKTLLTPRILSGMAAVAEAAEDWAGAQKHLDAWLVEDPKNAVALQRLGRALFQQNKPTEALAKLVEARKADEQVLTPEAIMAQLYEAAGQREEAAKMMVAALTADPKNLRTRLAAAQWAFESEQYDQAKEQAAIAMKLDPESLQAKILAGVVALFLADNKAAEGFFESAHLQSPGNFAALNNWALALAEQDDDAKKRKALEIADLGVRAFSNAGEAWSTYGWVLYRLKRVNEAEQALARAASAGQLSADTAYYIARVQVERGQSDRARELLKQALETKRPFSKRQDAESLLKALK